MREVIFVFSSERKAKENLIRLMKEEPLPGVGYELKAFPVT